MSFMFAEKKSALLVLAACLIWAIDLLVRYPVTLELSYIHIIFVESLLGFIFVSPWLFKNGKKVLAHLSKRDLLLLLFLGGVGMTLAGYLSTVSIQQATPGTFSFFQIFQPVLVVYLAHVFLKEKFDSLYIYWGLWVLLSAVLMYSQDIELMFMSGANPLEAFIAFSTMIIWGLCTVAAKKLLETHSPLILVAFRCLFAFLFAGVFLIFQKEALPWDIVFSEPFFWRFIFMSAGAGVLSMSLYYFGMKAMAAGKVSFIELSFPAFGMTLSALYTFERLTILQTVGAASFFIFILILFFRPSSRS